MKLNLYRVPSSEKLTTKQLIIRKVSSTLVISLAMAGATLVVNSARRWIKPSASVNAEAEGDTTSSVRPGLSRRRGAFYKAVEILADAAAEKPQLADYYDHVTKRVKGRAAEGEDTSGIAAVKPVRKINTQGIDAMTVKASATSSEGLAALAKGLIHKSAEAIDDSTPQPEDTHTEQQQFTVGDMAFDTNTAIEHWIDYYKSTPIGRRTMRIGIQRSSSYLEMARAEFRNAGVPEDLVWLAFVESVWNPRAVSPAAAGGLWQFIRPTATDYGLQVDNGVDERGDPIKQTHAAAVYLHDLYTIFGDWALAMAAYNSGEPRVAGAIAKNGRADFWELYDKELLPKETREYVPKILAAIRIASQAEDYGLVPNTQTPTASGS
jgi:Transglycosylase SLT domain